MRHKLLETDEGRRKFALILDAEEEAIASIRTFAAREGLSGTSITGIGAFSRCAFGHFDPVTRVFTRNDITVQAEALSLLGNIAGPDSAPDDDGDGDEASDGPRLHVHCVVGLRDATTRGGHLIEGWVRPTMELILVESPNHLQRGYDHASGLVLLQPNQKRD